MKNWRITLFAMILLVVSLSCSLMAPGGTSTTGGSTTNQGPGVSGLFPKPSGLIDKVTMAKDTQGSAMDPVNPTTVFSAKDTFHAVVHINNAPSDTQVKAIWYMVNVGDSSQNNQPIKSSDYTATGSGNIDFSLTIDSGWPTGTYQVEIYVKGVLDQVVNFSVK
jgi:hypothetical protein